FVTDRCDFDRNGLSLLAVDLQLANRIYNVVFSDNRVPVEHATSPPSANLHNDVLCYARTPEIARSGTPQIVEQQTRRAGSLADFHPSVAEVSYRLPILAGNHEIIGRLSLNTRGQELPEG